MKLWRVQIIIVCVIFVVISQETHAEDNDLEDQVTRMVRQVLEQLHVATCHLVLVDATNNSTQLPQIIRHVSFVMGMVVVEVRQTLPEDQSERIQFLQRLWGDPILPCRAFLILLDSDSTSVVTTSINNVNTTNDSNFTSSSNRVVRFLETCELWREPDTRVLVVGRRENVEEVLLHDTFRNTLHALYLALEYLTLQRVFHPPTSSNRLSKYAASTGEGEDVWVYERCLYCNHGDAGVHLLRVSNLTSGLQEGETLFRDQLADMDGHKLRLMVKSYFPFTEFLRSDDPSNNAVTLVDCLDVHLLTTAAAKHNFTYVIHASPDGQWGVPAEGGNWTGVVGQLHQKKADQSLMLMPTFGRSSVVQFSRLYTGDAILIVSLKPQLLPRYLSIIKPFPEVLWAVVLASMVAWGLALWIMQKTWAWLMDRRGINLSFAYFINWAILMENPQEKIPRNLMFRVLLGWWLVVCLVISTAYRSSLAAHLTVQEYSLPIKTFEDLVTRRHWKWGTFGDMLQSAFLEFFTDNGPLLRLVYNKTERLQSDEGLQRVLKGKYSFIAWKNMVKPVIAMKHTDRYGQNPFYLGTEYTYLLGYSWGFRWGAPQRLCFATFKQRLLEAGLVNYWLEKVLEKKKAPAATASTQQQDGDDGQVILSVDHVQGSFFVLGLGFGLALIVLVAEVIIHHRHSHAQDSHDGAHSHPPTLTPRPLTPTLTPAHYRPTSSIGSSSYRKREA
ncbi:probable glutamate receptor isoform X1 [Cherax quadricarinatus]